MTRVLLAEDHDLMRDGLHRILENAGFALVGEADDGEEVVELAARLLPDVVVMDISLPRRDGISATHALGSRAPGVRVVFLSMFEDEETIAACADAGGRAYLAKDCSAIALKVAIEKVAAGVDLLAAYRTRQRSILSTRTESLSTRTERLSGRETEVLQLVAGGASSAQIASSLYLSVKTVKNHLASIYEKLGVHDRTQAVIAGARGGLITLHVPVQQSREHAVVAREEIGRSTY